MAKSNPNPIRPTYLSLPRLASALLAAVLAGCAAGPDYVPPPAPTQHAYTAQPVPGPALEGPGPQDQTL